MFSSFWAALVYGILTTFVLGLIISWIIGLNGKKEQKTEQPSEIAHH